MQNTCAPFLSEAQGSGRGEMDLGSPVSWIPPDVRDFFVSRPEMGTADTCEIEKVSSGALVGGRGTPDHGRLLRMQLNGTIV
jgi:hypothetical protein